MPELPEILTIAKNLGDYVQNETILNVRVFVSKMFEKHLYDAESVIGSKIVSVSHRGKFLTMHLSSGMWMVFHLRLNGRIVYGDGFDDRGIVFELASDRRFSFYDPRRLATFTIVDSLEEIPTINNMGLEPLSTDFTYEYFKRNFLARKKMVKALLMDQSIVAGIGNIYSDEILFEAKINPLRKANTLSEEEGYRLYNSIKSIIEMACKLGGIRHYTDVGEFDEKIRVYRREGKKCPVCGAVIELATVSGRKTRFCPMCQPIS